MPKTTTEGGIGSTLLLLLSLISLVAFLLFHTPPLPFFPCYGFQKLFVICGWLSAFPIAFLMNSEFYSIQLARDTLYKTFYPFRKNLAKEGTDFRGSLSCDTGNLILRYSGLYLFTLSCFGLLANLPYRIFFDGRSIQSVIGYGILLLGYLILLMSYDVKPFIEYSNPQLTNRAADDIQNQIKAFIFIFSFPFLLFIGIGYFTKHPFFLSLIPYECLNFEVLDGKFESLSLTLVAITGVLALITKNRFDIYPYLVYSYIQRQLTIERLMQEEAEIHLKEEESGNNKPEEHEIKQKAQNININPIKHPNSRKHPYPRRK
jgi:hypothetical protein